MTGTRYPPFIPVLRLVIRIIIIDSKNGYKSLIYNKFSRVPVVFDSRHPYPTGIQARVPCLAGTRAGRVPTTGTRGVPYPCCTLTILLQLYLRLGEGHQTKGICQILSHISSLLSVASHYQGERC